ncbi:hypothetical protein N7492_009890 [Penicillium capsulatum]|uniref:FAD/NAD(P)-binding domain-containing protein n=1 Tax=Penicillium capsulatum TaxID=69766 RepID=A0A9W9LEX4_9EURO|nr:hypothetical protein N7492_009890 [Penicillium capsulatum]KAJ6112401.1 hypothetical protein N7512_007725 [Penicillium capsulatum]
MEKQRILQSDVVIIGAGLSGINMACQLQRQLNVSNFVLYDRASEMGGAWAANKYPGCGVDIPGVLYSLSWFPNPDFTSLFPSQREILAYVQRVARAYHVPGRTRLRTEWKGAKWMESSSTWHVYLHDLSTGEDFIHEAKALISAVGGYTNPKYPDLPGIEKFQGPVVHTAGWDQDYDLRGRNVAVVGNGCSGSQVVPAVMEDVQSLTQFIRTPQHYVPMAVGNYQFGKTFRAIFARVPIILLMLRWLVFWILDSALAQFYNDPQGQKARNERLAISQKYIEDNAPERYWPLLTPDQDLGCRRRILDNKYVRSLHNPKMQLVRDTITSVGPNSVTTASGKQHEVDFIVLATGFQFTQWKADTVVGKSGQSLQQHWDAVGGISAYKTIAMSDFPNMFYLLGPNAGSGHTSVLFAIECAVNLVIEIARPILKHEAMTVEVSHDAEIDWCDTIQSALSKTVLTQSCSNQYTDSKSGWNFFSYPFSSTRFWLGSQFPDMRHWVYC